MITTRGKAYKIKYLRFNGRKIKIIRQATQGKLK